jgi:hypothetical protein
MGLLTDGITNFLMKTFFKGTAERINNMIDPKGRAEVNNASNDFKKSVVKLRNVLNSPGVKKMLKDAGLKPEDCGFYNSDIDMTLYNEDGTPKGKIK